MIEEYRSHYPGTFLNTIENTRYNVSEDMSDED